MKRPTELIEAAKGFKSTDPIRVLSEYAVSLEQPRKTVSDAVDYYNGVWRSGEFKVLSWRDDEGCWSWGSPVDGECQVCTREQFEAEVERRKGEEWTHGIPPSGTYCRVDHEGELVNCYLIGRDDMGAFVYRVDGQYYQTMLETNFRPAKQVISVADAWWKAVNEDVSPAYIMSEYDVK